MDGRRVVLTGAASGIGRAIALRFAEAGAALELVDINAPGLKGLAEDLASTHDLTVHQIDLAASDDIRRLWAELRQRPVDVLVNNAGIYPFRSFLEVDQTFLQHVLDVNLCSVYWMCQEMVRQANRHGGVIVNVASVEAILPFQADLTHYGMSKAGVISLSRTLAKEYGPKGFRVNVLLPGGIDTPGTRTAARRIWKLNAGLVRSGLDFGRRLPLRRAGQADEVARMALVLATNLASYVNGAVIAVDGGFLSS